MSDYQLLDSGNERKIETFGPYTLIRPCLQAIWEPVNPKKWLTFDAEFTRDKANQWKKKNLPSHWEITFEELHFKLMPTDFGHIGIFPEHAMHWNYMRKKLKKGEEILNLFAYSGGATLALAKEGVRVCHVDASKGMVSWARENAALNHLEKAPIRWIVDDVMKFLKREVKRNTCYQGILLDPPTFGRGNQGQVFKIERDLLPLLQLCTKLLAPKESFIVLTTHTPGFTPLMLHHLLEQVCPKGGIESGEMVLSSQTFSLPSGSYARWSNG